MRGTIISLLAGCLIAGEAGPAPATITATDGAGPSASERTIDSTLAADQTWALARRQAELQAQARLAAAAKNTAQGNDNRGAPATPEPISPGHLAALADQDEVALLIELQRRRNRANGNAGSELIAGELAASAATTSTLPQTSTAPSEPGAGVHPADEPHPGPRAPTITDVPDRPERLPPR
jgi:hypothetical protein